MVNTAAVLAATTTFIGCQVNVVSLEYIVADPYGRSFGVGLTFLQFVTVAVLAFFLNVTRQAPSADHPRPLRLLGWRMQDRQLPVWALAKLTLVFWVMSTLNNYVFLFDISVPLHTIFRSSSLVATLALGFFFFGTRYSWAQALCTLVVTAGVTLLTLLTAEDRKGGRGGGGDGDLAWWALGIALLSVTTGLAPCLSLMQNRAYTDVRAAAAKKGRAAQRLWPESLLMNHLLSLPLFAASLGPWTLYDQITGLPAALLPHVAVNVVSQFFCIVGVYVLVDVMSPMAMTLVITMRKFSSVVVSLWLFRHGQNFGPMHYAAVVLAMGGAAAYPFLPKAAPAPKPAPQTPSDGKPKAD